MKIVISTLLCVFLIGCANTNKEVLDSDYSHSSAVLKKRSYQTKQFDSNDKNMIMRGILATLQDFGFIIEKADATFGTVTAVLLSSDTTVTVTIRQNATNTKTIVRVNAMVKLEEQKDPKFYQKFFLHLSKSIFLDAHEVDFA